MRIERQSPCSLIRARICHNGQDGMFIRLPIYLAVTLMGGTVLLPETAQAQETMPRAQLEEMARSQYAVLCESDIFVECMGFTGSACSELAESAIRQCLLPLPEEIVLDQLDNSALESCPKRVFGEAGFTEEKAEMCFDEAMDVE